MFPIPFTLPCLVCPSSHPSFLWERAVPRGRGMSVTKQPALPHMLQLVGLSLCVCVCVSEQLSSACECLYSVSFVCQRMSAWRSSIYEFSVCGVEVTAWNMTAKFNYCGAFAAVQVHLGLPKHPCVSFYLKDNRGRSPPEASLKHSSSLVTTENKY